MADRTSEMVLGYSLREAWRGGDYWTARRRSCELLSMAIPQPRSVDTNVWWDAFTCADIPEVTSPETHYGLLAFSCSALIESWRPHNVGRTAHVVAITWPITNTVSPLVEPARVPAWFGRDSDWPSMPSRASEDWQLLGYDVSSVDFCSVLASSGPPIRYMPESCRCYWRDRLNDHHLFASQADALSFVDVCRQDFPRRTYAIDTYAFGLWFVAEIDGRPESGR